MASRPAEVRQSRFAFGRNWKNYLGVVDEERMGQAVASLDEMVGADRVRGATFLDVGSGSGLFSLAANRLGASRIHSFDFDVESVSCTEAMRDRHASPGVVWSIERGSALDAKYLASLGEWDIVYSWGVLHHTGAMWKAIDQVAQLVKPGGVLFISIYNDQGWLSNAWTIVKQTYNKGPAGRFFVTSVFVPYFVGRGLLADLFRMRNPLRRYREYRQARGMSLIHDWRDWLGGLPFEVARPEEVVHFCQARGFSLHRLKTCGGSHACNEFVFRRSA